MSMKHVIRPIMGLVKTRRAAAMITNNAIATHMLTMTESCNSATAAKVRAQMVMTMQRITSSGCASM